MNQDKNPRPYRDITPLQGEHERYLSEEKKADRRERTILLLVLGFILLVLLFILAAQDREPRDSQPLIPAYHKTEIMKRLAARKLPGNTTVEISARGYRFLWRGEWYPL